MSLKYRPFVHMNRLTHAGQPPGSAYLTVAIIFLFKFFNVRHGWSNIYGHGASADGSNRSFLRSLSPPSFIGALCTLHSGMTAWSVSSPG